MYFVWILNGACYERVQSTFAHSTSNFSPVPLRLYHSHAIQPSHTKPVPYLTTPSFTPSQTSPNKNLPSPITQINAHIPPIPQTTPSHPISQHHPPSISCKKTPSSPVASVPTPTQFTTFRDHPRFGAGVVHIRHQAIVVSREGGGSISAYPPRQTG